MRQSLDRFIEQLGKHITAYGYWDGVSMIPPTRRPEPLKRSATSSDQAGTVYRRN